jgi:hypothetical protein
MAIRAVVFDLFHTLTGPESKWSDLPWTSDVLGIDRRTWNELLTSHSRWRLAGAETDPFVIISTLARMHDPLIGDDTIRRRGTVAGTDSGEARARRPSHTEHS